MNTHEAGGSPSGQHLPLKTVQVPFTPRRGSAAGMISEGILLIPSTHLSQLLLMFCGCVNVESRSSNHIIIFKLM